MYRGFKLKTFPTSDENYTAGLKLFNSQKKIIQKELTEFMSSDNSLDGSKIQSNWFPQVDVEVFISHSHNDEKPAICLAGWLWKNFGIKSFIDSLIWGYANHLLKEIDDEFCKSKDGKTYDYQSRNSSTAHVHMMLSAALTMMIDKSECLIFLDSPNSIKPIDGIVNTTQSPWIYFEITTSQTVQKRTPSRLFEHRTLSEKFMKGIEANYTVDLEHLSEINNAILSKWVNKEYMNAEKALDELYNLVPAKKRSDLLHG